MKTKLLALGIILLTCANVFPLVGAHTVTPVPRTTDTIWSDNFDSYQNGQRLDGTPDDGGWKGWGNISDNGGTVTDAQNHSSPYSDMVQDMNDQVHDYSITSGTFNYTAWQYIPDNFSGITFFNLLSHYTDGGNNSNNWAVLIRFDSDSGLVESKNDALTLPLVTGRWVELLTVINLTRDRFQFFYDGDLLVEKNWSAQYNNSGGGPLTLEAVEMWSFGATSVYYDDMSITTAGEQQNPELQIANVTGGRYIGAVVKNVGNGTATDVSWIISLSGGLILKGKTSTGDLGAILAGNQAPITSGKIIGFGKVNIILTATCTEGVTTDRTVSGFVFLFFVLGVK